MLDKLTKDSFSPYIDQTFRLVLGPDAEVELELTEVTPLKSPHSGIDDSEQHIRREPFSILFRGPADVPLDQRMYRIEHAEMGLIDGLFITPVGADQRGRYYEAIFN